MLDSVRNTVKNAGRVLLNNSKPAQLVAEQLLWIRRNGETTPLGVTWLAYLCHGWMLGFYNRALIDEPIEAQYHSPTISSLYNRYRAYEGSSIDVPVADQSSEFDEEQLDIIGGVETAYHSFSDLELSRIVTKRDTPWDIVSRQHGTGTIIPNKLIREYYSDFTKRIKEKKNGK